MSDTITRLVERDERRTLPRLIAGTADTSPLPLIRLLAQIAARQAASAPAARHAA